MRGCRKSSKYLNALSEFQGVQITGIMLIKSNLFFTVLGKCIDGLIESLSQHSNLSLLLLYLSLLCINYWLY